MRSNGEVDDDGPKFSKLWVEGGKAGIPGWNPAVMERFLTRKTRKRALRLRRRKRTKQ